MLHRGRWAAVFVTSLGKNATMGLVCLKAVVPAIKGVSGVLFGYSAARHLEKVLRESAGAGLDNVTEYVIRFIVLAVEKNQFKNIDSILEKIEEQVDVQNGVLVVTVESAAALDNDFQEELRRNIIKQTGAAEIKMKTRLIPDLLGGYRIRIGGFYIDASLKGQIEEMKTTLVGGMLYGGL